MIEWRESSSAERDSAYFRTSRVRGATTRFGDRLGPSVAIRAGAVAKSGKFGRDVGK